MQPDQIRILVIILLTAVMFVWERWRHDMVAIGALLACVGVGLVPASAAFSGFGHPAVVTVACVLVLSRALQLSGVVDRLSHRLLPTRANAAVSVAWLSTVAAMLSAFMNNVGALALMMPLAMQLAARHAMPPGKVLMPVAFGSILGGMITLIGTPPNLIVSGFRAGVVPSGGFGMFDFAPVGIAVAALGILLMAILGRRLIPTRIQSGVTDFVTGQYLTEVRVTDDSDLQGKTLRGIGDVLAQSDAQVVDWLRDGRRLAMPGGHRRFRSGDILVMEAEPAALSALLSVLGLTLAEAVAAPVAPNSGKSGTAPPTGESRKASARGDAEPQLIELVVLPSAAIIGRTATDILLRTRYGINLLALSRRGRRSIRRLRTAVFRAGDLLLLQGSAESISGFAADFGCVPLAPRAIHVPSPRRAVAATLILVASVAVAAIGWTSAAVAFAAGVLACMAFRVLPWRDVYRAVDWPVVVLLAALIPVADAMEKTGTADLLAMGLLARGSGGHAVWALTLLMAATMSLSAVLNNAATAAVMCPIALGAARALGVQTDPFLMAVAVGASCSFVTPIGHQNNTLILGPGGFRFGDFWRLGLALQLLILAVGVPLILWFWPLR